jgi:hypothetical protein
LQLLFYPAAYRFPLHRHSGGQVHQSIFLKQAIEIICFGNFSCCAMMEKMSRQELSQLPGNKRGSVGNEQVI